MRQLAIVVSVVYFNSCANLHRDLHHDLDVLRHFSFTPKHYLFPLQNILNAFE